MEDYYTVKEVAKLLKVHWQSVLNYIKRGELEAVRIGRGYRVGKASLNNFIANRTVRKDAR